MIPAHKGTYGRPTSVHTSSPQEHSFCVESEFLPPTLFPKLNTRILWKYASAWPFSISVDLLGLFSCCFQRQKGEGIPILKTDMGLITYYDHKISWTASAVKSKTYVLGDHRNQNNGLQFFFFSQTTVLIIMQVIDIEINSCSTLDSWRK